MENHERFPPIGDYALIGDCHSAALVSRSGSIDWCCLPRFDAGSAFAALLDREQGGRCTIDPVDEGDWESSREYLDDTLVLSTTLQGPSGAFAVLDCMTAGEGERIGDDRELLRVIEGRRGSVELELRIAPRFDYGQVTPWIRRHGQRLHTVVGGNDALVVWCDAELNEDPRHQLVARLRVGAGERVRLSMAYARPELVDGDGPDGPDGELLDARLRETVQWWRDWAGGLRLGTRDEPAARRSGIALKALTYEPTGAIVAAATTSLPEAIGRARNWDYRYAWVRDASFSARAFAELGAEQESDAFRAFMMRSAAGHAEELQVLYGVGGERRLQGQVAEGLEGYRESAPVRVGNDAAGQRQLDAYGEIVNLIWRWHRRGHSPDDDDWRFLMSVIEHAAEQWQQPDHGIWEWPGDPEHFVHSKVLCWSALNRGLRLADECMRRAPVRRWRRVRDEIREAVESRGCDRERGVFVQAFDHPELDAALLLLPTVEFVDWDDERMVRTVAAIREELHAGGGLLYRYRRRDGLGGREGAFLCCSFWLAECLARQGDRDGARSVFDAAVARANDVMLFSEEVDPKSGELLGNFPQALTHLAHIDAAVALAQTG